MVCLQKILFKTILRMEKFQKIRLETLKICQHRNCCTLLDNDAKEIIIWSAWTH